MTTTSRDVRQRFALSPWVAGLALCAAIGGPAQAQEDDGAPTLDIQRFDPTAQRPGFTLVRDAEAMRQWTFTGVLTASYALHPFELGDGDTNDRTAGVIDNLIGFDLGFAFAPLKWFNIALDIPVLQIQASDEVSRSVAEELGGGAGTVGLGDMRITLAFHPVRQRQNGKISFAVIPFVGVPSGSRGQFLGSGAVTVGGDLALGGRWRHFRFTTHAGYAYMTETAPVGTILSDDEFRFGAGLGVPFGDKDRFEVELEFVGGAVVTTGKLADINAKPFDNLHTPMELHAGFAWVPPDFPMFVKLGLGPGLSNGFGTPDFRAYGQIGGVLQTKDTGPPDADGDGIPDERDACPSVPEDFDGFEDQDGCPEPDNDLDRILDVDDNCPLDPEDYDTFQDDDGCPDPDNDLDTILDLDDACMMEAEDFDDWRDEDGCPEPDNDFDGFLDPDDQCPNEPEVINGVEDDDGCPDDALAMIDVETQEIRILEKIYFELNKAIIRPVSWPVIEAVATIMNAYPDIQLIEVQGHTDERGSDSYNLDLSQRRSEAVVDALVKLGVDRSRLTGKGYGETDLVVRNAQIEAEHARNRRVQFVIIQRSEDVPVIDHRDPGAEPNPEDAAAQ